MKRHTLVCTRFVTCLPLSLTCASSASAGCCKYWEQTTYFWSFSLKCYSVRRQMGILFWKNEHPVKLLSMQWHIRYLSFPLHGQDFQIQNFTPKNTQQNPKSSKICGFSRSIWKILHLTELFYTGTARGARDKYQVWFHHTMDFFHLIMHTLPKSEHCNLH